MSESVPRGNRPAEELREWLEFAGGRLAGVPKPDVLDAALRAERLAGRQEALMEVRDGYDGDKSHWFGQWLGTLLDEVGVAGLTEEGS